MFDELIHIDIHIPHSWQQCTTEQLEAIAAAIASVAHRADGFHPFEWIDVKALAFLPLAELEQVDESDEVGSDEHGKKESDGDRKIWVKFTDKHQRNHRSDKWIKPIDKFPLRIWQIHSLIHDHLQWLGKDNDGNEVKPTIYNFPYPQIHCPRTFSSCRSGSVMMKSENHFGCLFRKVHGIDSICFYGCSSLMQDFTWRRYRYAQDFMSAYVRASNAFVRMQLHGRTSNVSDIALAMTRQDDLCAKFLACCFSPRIKVQNKNTGKRSNEYVWDPSMVEDNYVYFRKISTTVRWQVVMLWWSSMQYYLQQKFPKCFSVSETDVANRKKKLPPNPLELYVRGAATLSKYLGLTEEEVNEQNFQIILQHMNDMAEDNERMEKLNKK